MHLEYQTPRASFTFWVLRASSAGIELSVFAALLWCRKRVLLVLEYLSFPGLLLALDESLLSFIRQTGRMLYRNLRLLQFAAHRIACQLVFGNLAKNTLKMSGCKRT